MSARSDLRALRKRHQDTLDALDDAVTDNTGLLDTIKRQCREITSLRDEVNALRHELADARTPEIGWAAERRDLRRENFELRQARAHLDARLIEVQAANEHLCREAVDRAGTLAKVEVPA